jgi:hypothetical protein
MSRLATFLLILILLTPALAASSQEAAPFGLTWGATLQEIEAAGAVLEPVSNKEFGDSFIARNLPKALADQRSTHLAFGFNNSLWRIYAVGKPYESEPQGLGVKDRYEQLLGTLSEKYGMPNRVQKLGDSIYKDPEYFISGIREGKNIWFADFARTGVFVQLGIIAPNSAGSWQVIYEHKALRALFDASKKNREKEAL